VRRINEAPACELCGNWTTKSRALCASCDESMRLCEEAPRRGPTLTAPTEIPAFMKTLPERRRLREPVRQPARVVDAPPSACMHCGERKVFDLRLHVCREDRRTA
jgi:ferredoxin